MKPHEIASAKNEPPRGEEWLWLLTAQAHWLREIAYQFAVFNDILSSDVAINLSIHQHGGVSVEQLEPLFHKLSQELTKMAKVLSDEARSAVMAALSQLGIDIKAAVETSVETSVTNETAQIVAAIQKLATQNGPITREDVGGILDLIKGAAPAMASSISESLTGKIDKISTDAGADEKPGEGEPEPKPEPTA